MTSEPQLSCDEVETLLPLVADGALDATNEPALFHHVASCPRCQDSLALHDLVSVSLSRLAPPQAPRIIRSAWWRTLPAAAAAALVLIGLGALGWQAHTVTPAAQVSESQELVAAAVATPQVLAAKPNPTSPDEPVEVEVIAMPGSTPDQPHYLVRKGEQVLFVDPAAAPPSAPQAPENAQAASFRRY